MPGGKFRILHREQFKGSDFEAQADAIKRIPQQYNVMHIGIDKTGLGAGVFQIVEKFFPQVKGHLRHQRGDRRFVGCGFRGW
ncbi:hypothetical protein [Variovorax sp.]|uniref:phage terminase large subunit family protein n=1 Tax=Variovorax sp. TaxID=1871043 RepID=UPI003D116C2A